MSQIKVRKMRGLRVDATRSIEAKRRTMARRQARRYLDGRLRIGVRP